LPVRRYFELRAKAELERIDVDDLRELRRHFAERFAERGRICVRVHEDQRARGVDGDLLQAELVGLEPRLTVRARCGAQLAVEAVRPRVVGALERASLSRAAGGDVAPVAAPGEGGAPV